MWSPLIHITKLKFWKSVQHVITKYLSLLCMWFRPLMMTRASEPGPHSHFVTGFWPHLGGVGIDGVSGFTTGAAPRQDKTPAFSGINASLPTPLLEYVIRFLKINVYHYYLLRSPGIYWDTEDLLSTFDQVVARFHRVTCYDLTQCWPKTFSPYCSSETM